MRLLCVSLDVGTGRGTAIVLELIAHAKVKQELFQGNFNRTRTHPIGDQTSTRRRDWAVVHKGHESSATVISHGGPSIFCSKMRLWYVEDGDWSR